MTPFKQDTTLLVEVYHIEDFETQENSYEGHYPHSNTKVSKTLDSINFRKGDLYIKTFQPAVRYLIETLEPSTPDSFFNWNFFDSILQQKEGYSSYVFEELAKKILEEDPALKEEFQDKKKTDREFSRDPEAQLDWIHKQSIYYESAHLKYPVFRVGR